MILSSVISSYAGVMPENVNYKINQNGTVSITKSPEATGDIVIPEQVEIDGKTYDITIIEAEAFMSTEVNSVVLPNTIKRIGDYAFEGSSIKQISLGNSVETIGEQAFGSCDITSIKLPDSLIELGWYAFEGTSITEIDFGKGLTEIPLGAFDGCNINYLSIPSTVSKIGFCAFSNCENLKEVFISDGVKYINAAAFFDCSNLTKVRIPGSITSLSGGGKIDGAVFKGCYSLKNVIYETDNPIAIPENIPDIFSWETYSEGTLTVAIGGAAKARNIYPWKNFRNIAEANFNDIKAVGTDDNDQIHISVVNGTVVVNGVDGLTEIAIYDTCGRIIYKRSDNQITNLTSGIYILKAGKQTAKFTI